MPEPAKNKPEKHEPQEPNISNVEMTPVEFAMRLARERADSYLRGHHDGVQSMLLVVSIAGLSVGLFFRFRAVLSNESK